MKFSFISIQQKPQWANRPSHPKNLKFILKAFTGKSLKIETSNCLKVNSFKSIQLNSNGSTGSRV